MKLDELTAMKLDKVTATALAIPQEWKAIVRRF